MIVILQGLIASVCAILVLFLIPFTIACGFRVGWMWAEEIMRGGR